MLSAVMVLTPTLPALPAATAVTAIADEVRSAAPIVPAAVVRNCSPSAVVATVPLGMLD